MPAPCGSQEYSQCPDPVSGHCWPTPPPKTPGHPQAILAQPLVGSLLLLPRSWCTQVFACALWESFFPVLCKFCNQIPLAFKVKLPGGSQSLCWILRLGNLLWVLELSQQCENFFCISVLQLSDCLLSGSMVGLTPHLPGLLSQSPCPCSRPLLTHASTGDT